MITAGAIQAISNVLALTVDCADDVVLTTRPAYGLYKHQTELLGGTFAALPTDAASGFVPTAAALRAAFRAWDAPRTDSGLLATTTTATRNRVRALVLCFPNNPTGAMLTKPQAQEIAAVLDEELCRHPTPGFVLVLDEVYLGICHQEFYSILQVGQVTAPDWECVEYTHDMT